MLFDPLGVDAVCTAQLSPQVSAAATDVIFTLAGGRSLSLAECHENLTWDGGTVSDAAHRLSRVIDSDHFAPGVLVQQCVLVLGAGCGLEGLVAAALGATVILAEKDLAVASPTLEANIKRNELGALAEVLNLDWERPDAAGLAALRTRFINVCCAADCVLVEDDVIPLLRTAHSVAQSETVVYICGVAGGDLSRTFLAAADRFFEARSVIVLPQDAGRGDEPS